MASKKEVTTIKISKDTVKALNQLKIHPRQSYEEVILNLLKKKGGTKKQ
jgi:predicted CopG family antitoxin